MAFDAAAGELRFRVVQFPGQAGATKGFRSSGEGGARREALRFCAGFVDGALTTVQQDPSILPVTETLETLAELAELQGAVLGILAL